MSKLDPSNFNAGTESGKMLKTGFGFTEGPYSTDLQTTVLHSLFDKLTIQCFSKSESLAFFESKQGVQDPPNDCLE